MARDTAHIVQSFRRHGKRLIADQPRKMKTAEAAIAGAKQLVATRIGVVAYTIETDAQVDYTGEPKVLCRAGDLPPELQD